MSCGKWAPLKLIAIVSLLLYSMGWRGEHTPNRLKRKLATEPRVALPPADKYHRLTHRLSAVYLHHADTYHRFTRPTVTGSQRPRREGSHGLLAALSPG